jgi:iron complex transport system ATP-binding protein
MPINEPAMTLLGTGRLSLRIGELQICTDTSLAFAEGEIWGILGCNGSGKTTLLHTLAGLRHADGGAVQLLGQDLNTVPRRQVARDMGILFQQQEELFPATVLESALAGRHPFLKAWQWESEQDVAITKQALRDTELSGLSTRAINTLSGGEMQRLKIATLLTQNPRLMLLDEPTNHLDLNHQVKLLSLLVTRARKQRGAIVMALHDINLAARFCTHILVLAPGSEPRGGTVADMLKTDILQQAYGWPLARITTPAGTFFYPE